MAQSIPPGEQASAGHHLGRDKRPDKPPSQTLLFPDNDAAEPGPPANDPVPARRMRQQALPIFAFGCEPPQSPEHRTVVRPRQYRRG